MRTDSGKDVSQDFRGQLRDQIGRQTACGVEVVLVYWLSTKIAGLGLSQLLEELHNGTGVEQEAAHCSKQLRNLELQQGRLQKLLNWQTRV